MFKPGKVTIFAMVFMLGACSKIGREGAELASKFSDMLERPLKREFLENEAHNIAKAPNPELENLAEYLNFQISSKTLKALRSQASGRQPFILYPYYAEYEGVFTQNDVSATFLLEFTIERDCVWRTWSKSSITGNTEGARWQLIMTQDETETLDAMRSTLHSQSTTTVIDTPYALPGKIIDQVDERSTVTKTGDIFILDINSPNQSRRLSSQTAMLSMEADRYLLNMISLGAAEFSFNLVSEDSDTLTSFEKVTVTEGIWAGFDERLFSVNQKSYLMTEGWEVLDSQSQSIITANGVELSLSVVRGDTEIRAGLVTFKPLPTMSCN